MATTTTTTTTSDVGEGPVMALINKRLRALRKKLNRITQMEESLSQGKTLNKEQQEVLRSKPSVLTLIEELDKLRTPLSAAVSEEISLATHNTPPPPPPSVQNDVVNTQEVQKLEDLVNLLYFGSLFDVKSQSELASVMMRRRHERGCCLVYDTVSDESTDLLCDKDLDLISRLLGMMVSRPLDSGLSHEKALERCVEHAKLWLANSDKEIASDCDVSYAGLREKLKKIMGSNYFTITPEMVVAPVEVEVEGGSYGSFQVGTDNEQKEEDASNFKEQESFVNDQSEQPKDESVTEGEVVREQQEQGYTQVEGGRSRRGNQQQQYVPRGTHQNQRGHRGARRGHSYAPRGGRGGYSNGRYESNDNSGGNGYQRSYYNNRGRGRGRGGGGGGYNNNNHQDSNVSVTS